MELTCPYISVRDILEFTTLIQWPICPVIPLQIYYSLSRKYKSIMLWSFLQASLSCADPHVHVNLIKLVVLFSISFVVIQFLDPVRVHIRTKAWWKRYHSSHHPCLIFPCYHLLPSNLLHVLLFHHVPLLMIMSAPQGRDFCLPCFC